jgi:serine protease
MRRIRFAYITILLAAIPGCAPTPDPIANDNAPSSQISGALSVLADFERTSVNEVEPNDDFSKLTPTATAAVGTQIELFGTVQDDDRSDVYLIAATSAMRVDVILSFDFAPDETDFGFAIYDFDTVACQLGDSGLPSTACVDDDRNPESGTFDVNNDFAIIVHAVRGGGNYAVGLTFEDPADASSAKRSASRADEWVILFDERVPARQCRQVLSAHDIAAIAESPSGAMLVRTPDITRLTTLRREPVVTRIEPNYILWPAAVPDDPFYDNQWHYELINLPDAWDQTTGADDLVVAVIDTGLLLDHPEFSGRLIAGFDFISDPTSSRDGDGIDSDPTDNGDLSGGPGQSSFHGTHVAGTIAAATDNGEGVSGILWNGLILPVRALGANGGTSFDIAEAIRYAAGLPNISGEVPTQTAQVINLSIAGPAGGSASVVMENAINDAVAREVIVVASAGNEGSTQPSYPAAYDAVIAIAACGPQMEIASYSNTGSYLDLTAPGGDLGSDVTGDGFVDGVLSLSGTEQADGVESAYSLQQGTSMASPHVAGVAALMRAVNPSLPADTVREILRDTARDVGSAGFDSTFGAGVLDAAGAVTAAAEEAGATPVTEPRLSLSSDSLDFGASRDELVVQITNTGAEHLVIENVVADEAVGAGWLSAELMLDDTSQTSNATSIIVEVDRADQPDGRYRGTLTVSASDLEPQTIDVAMNVGTAFREVEIIFVVAIDANTRQAVQQDWTTAEDDFEFTITGLAAGTYKIYAGTDRDDDGFICDLGELCGGQPSAIRATDVTLSDGQTVSDLSFAVGELLFQAASDSDRFTPIRLPR